MAVEEGTAFWASIRTPNTKFEPVYSVNLVVDQETADKYSADGYTIKTMDEGPALVIKRKVNGANGGQRPAPRLLDSENNDVDVAVGNGSKVRVQFNPWESTNKFGTFKGLDLQAVKILDLVPYKSADGQELLDGEEF